jgi:hypothetical protein
LSKAPANDSDISLHHDKKMADSMPTAPIEPPPNSTSDIHGGES